MALKLGANSINKLYFGSTPINKAYLGAGILFSGGFSPASLFAGGQKGLWLEVVKLPPELLFAGGTEGAWFDPSDLSTLFQDSGGTTPVTTSGQPVGKMLDKSGNGNHAVQATSAKRPTYTAGGGLHWLAFDGTDDAMATAAIDFTDTDKGSVFAGVRRLDETVRMIFEFSSDANDHAGSSYLVSGKNSIFTGYSAYVSLNSRQLTGFNDATNPITNVVSATHDISGGLSTIRVDGVAGINGTTNGEAGNFGNYPLFIGTRAASSLFFNGNLYGLIIPGKMASADEIASTEAYMAEKSGVTL